MSFAIYFAVGGMFFYIPFLFGSEEKSILDFLYTYTGEVSAIILVYFIIDLKVLCRKTQLIIGTILMIAVQVSIYFLQTFLLIVMITLTRFLVRFNALVQNPILAEAYSTYYRAYGIGFAQGCGRIGSSLAPFLIY